MSKKKLAGIIAGCIIVVIVVVVITTLQPTYTLSVSVTPSGAGSVSPSGGEYESREQVTLTASPASGYTFNHWSGNASGTTSTITITMDSDKSVTASFLTGLKLTTSISPADGGSISLSPDGGVYSAGTVVTLTATAAEGYTFDSWGGDANGGIITTSIIMDANKSVTANFRNLLAEGILFEDYFDDDRNNWGEDADIKDSALHFQVSAQEGKTSLRLRYKWPFEAPNYPNFGYKVDMTVIEHKANVGIGGIIFLGDPAEHIEGRHCFIFAIHPYGYYSFYYYQLAIEDELEQQYRTVVDWTASSFINRDNSTNELEVICCDFVIELYVNGHLLKEVHGEFPDNIGSNGIGLFIQASGGTAHLAFDNMKMWALNPHE